MNNLKERAAASWLVLSLLNIADLYLYIESLRHPEVNEIWFLGLLSPNEVIVIKLLLPVFVAGILSIRTSERIVKTIWYLCALYAVVFIWNLLQFI